MTYNHSRTLESFNNELQQIKAKGFNPIAVTQMMFEDYYIFETEEEAVKAYHTFEVDKKGKWLGKVVGWWSSKEDLNKAVEEYENSTKNKVLVYWL